MFAAVRKGGVDTVVTSSDFSEDPLDGSKWAVNTDTLNIDPFKMNVYRVSTGWLGATPALFAVMSEEGVWIPAHKVKHANLQDGVITDNLHLPVRGDVDKRGEGSTNLQLKMGSWNAGTVRRNNKSKK